MPKRGSVNVGGDVAGSVIVTGDRNKVDAKIEATLLKTTLPPAESVDLPRELAQIRAVLERIGGEHANRIGRALDHAAEEAQKPAPNKDEIGVALDRALDYAKKGNSFAEEISSLAPHLINAVAWLGSNWAHLLSVVGLAL